MKMILEGINFVCNFILNCTSNIGYIYVFLVSCLENSKYPLAKNKVLRYNLRT